jgi:hypothetical protein
MKLPMVAFYGEEEWAIDVVDGDKVVRHEEKTFQDQNLSFQADHFSSIYWKLADRGNAVRVTSLKGGSFISEIQVDAAPC